MYDICVIGGGPAGLTAALYSLRAGRSTLLMEEKTFGGQMAETSVIENMPGSPDAQGWELAMQFGQQVEQLGVSTAFEKATKLELQGNHLRICTDSDVCYEARRVILAMGVRRRHLNVPGEARLAGHGIGWCAVCDGAFFRGQDVAVVGGGNTALEDALYLSGICSTVHLLVRKNEFRAQTALVQRVIEKENIKVRFQAEVTEILGDSKVSGITVTQNGVVETIPLSGVFIAIGLSPDTSLYGNLVETDPSGYIVAGEDCRTSVPGVFAAGDIRTKEIRQIVTALSDGAVAAELAGRELS